MTGYYLAAAWLLSCAAIIGFFAAVSRVQARAAAIDAAMARHPAGRTHVDDASHAEWVAGLLVDFEPEVDAATVAAREARYLDIEHWLNNGGGAA